MLEQYRALQGLGYWPAAQGFCHFLALGNIHFGRLIIRSLSIQDSEQFLTRERGVQWYSISLNDLEIHHAVLRTRDCCLDHILSRIHSHPQGCQESMITRGWGCLKLGEAHMQIPYQPLSPFSHQITCRELHGIISTLHHPFKARHSHLKKALG